jgi:hypothetical protein
MNWDRNLPSASRFTILPEFNNEAVRDNNTGLVWERAPDATRRNWPLAITTSLNKIVGGTMGWRLPSVVELKSLQDPTLPAPFVPASVFTGVQLDFYWSATAQADFPTSAWGVFFSNGNMGLVNYAVKGTNQCYIWCVRGPMNADAY